MAEFGEFLINNMRSSLEPEDLQILHRSSGGSQYSMGGGIYKESVNCPPIKEEDGCLGLGNTMSSDQLEYARKWAEDVSTYTRRHGGRPGGGGGGGGGGKKFEFNGIIKDYIKKKTKNLVSEELVLDDRVNKLIPVRSKAAPAPLDPKKKHQQSSGKKKRAERVYQDEYGQSNSLGDDCLFDESGEFIDDDDDDDLSKYDDEEEEEEDENDDITLTEPESEVYEGQSIEYLESRSMLRQAQAKLDAKKAAVGGKLYKNKNQIMNNVVLRRRTSNRMYEEVDDDPEAPSSAKEKRSKKPTAKTTAANETTATTGSRISKWMAYGETIRNFAHTYRQPSKGKEASVSAKNKTVGASKPVQVSPTRRQGFIERLIIGPESTLRNIMNRTLDKSKNSSSNASSSNAITVVTEAVKTMGEPREDGFIVGAEVKRKSSLRKKEPVFLADMLEDKPMIRLSKKEIIYKRAISNKVALHPAAAKFKGFNTCGSAASDAGSIASQKVTTNPIYESDSKVNNEEPDDDDDEEEDEEAEMKTKCKMAFEKKIKSVAATSKSKHETLRKNLEGSLEDKEKEKSVVEKVIKLETASGTKITEKSLIKQSITLMLGDDKNYDELADVSQSVKSKRADEEEKDKTSRRQLAKSGSDSSGDKATKTDRSRRGRAEEASSAESEVSVDEQAADSNGILKALKAFKGAFNKSKKSKKDSAKNTSYASSVNNSVRFNNKRKKRKKAMNTLNKNSLLHSRKFISLNKFKGGKGGAKSNKKSSSNQESDFSSDYPQRKPAENGDNFDNCENNIYCNNTKDLGVRASASQHSRTAASGSSIAPAAAANRSRQATPKAKMNRTSSADLDKSRSLLNQSNASAKTGLSQQQQQQPKKLEEKCKLKNREKLLTSWDKVIKNASKDPQSLKELLKLNSQKALDDYRKKMKSAENASAVAESSLLLQLNGRENALSSGLGLYLKKLNENKKKKKKTKKAEAAAAAAEKNNLSKEHHQSHHLLSSNDETTTETSKKSGKTDEEAPSSSSAAAAVVDAVAAESQINHLLMGAATAGKQGELIRSLFSYLNQYGDDGFTIKAPPHLAVASVSSQSESTDLVSKRCHKPPSIATVFESTERSDPTTVSKEASSTGQLLSNNPNPAVASKSFASSLTKSKASILKSKLPNEPPSTSDKTSSSLRNNVDTNNKCHQHVSFLSDKSRHSRGGGGELTMATSGKGGGASHSKKSSSGAKPPSTEKSSSRLTSLQHYLRCCVEKTGSASTIGSRHMSFTERSIYNNSSKSNLFSSSNAKSTTNRTSKGPTTTTAKDTGADSKTLKSAQGGAGGGLREAKSQSTSQHEMAKQKLNESRRENPDFWSNLHQLDMDKLIQSLDEEGKVEFLRKKLSLYLKAKKLNSTSVFDDTLTETTNPLNEHPVSRKTSNAAAKNKNLSNHPETVATVKTKTTTKCEGTQMTLTLAKCRERRETRASIEIQVPSPPPASTPSPVPPPCGPPPPQSSAPTPRPPRSQAHESSFNNEDRSKSEATSTMNTRTRFEMIARQKIQEQQKLNYQRQLDMIEKRVGQLTRRNNNRMRTESPAKSRCDRSYENSKDGGGGGSQNESEIEMFYFTSESPTRKTLMKNKTQQLFKGFCKRLQSQAANTLSKHVPSASTPNSDVGKKTVNMNHHHQGGGGRHGKPVDMVTNNDGSFYFRLSPDELARAQQRLGPAPLEGTIRVAHLNDSSHPPSHQYQHQNIFKTLFKSKNLQTLRRTCETCHRLKSFCKCSYETLKQARARVAKNQASSSDMIVKQFDDIVHDRSTDDLLSHMTSANDQINDASDAKSPTLGARARTPIRSVARRINFFSHGNQPAFEAPVHGSKHRRFSPPPMSEQQKVKTRERIKNHMRELAHAFNEKFQVNRTLSPVRNNRAAESNIKLINTGRLIDKRRISSKRKKFAHSSSNSSFRGSVGHRHRQSAKWKKVAAATSPAGPAKTTRQLLKEIATMAKKKEADQLLRLALDKNCRQTNDPAKLMFTPSPINVTNDINYYEEEEVNEPNIYELDGQTDEDSDFEQTKSVYYKCRYDFDGTKSLRNVPSEIYTSSAGDENYGCRSSTGYFAAKRAATAILSKRSHRVIPRIDQIILQ